MKRLAFILFVLSSGLAFAGSPKYEATIVVEIHDARAFLASLNQQLNLKLDVKVFADYAESIAVGNEYSHSFDMHHDGIVFTATYKIAKREQNRVELSFISLQKRATRAICQQMDEFSRAGSSEYSPKSCEYDQLERFEI